MNNYKVTVALNPDNTLSKEEADHFADCIKGLNGDCSGFVLILACDTENPGVTEFQSLVYDIGENPVIHSMRSSKALSDCARISTFSSILGIPVSVVDKDGIPVPVVDDDRVKP